MRFEEQVYTSAPELLDRSGGHLGVVAQSRDFPKELINEFEALRSYHMLPSIPVERLQEHPPGYIVTSRGPRRAYFTISQTVHAGADHTGRTRPLVHHLVFAKSRLVGAGLMPADILRRVKGICYGEWRGAPAWIDPPRELDSHVRDDGAFPSQQWQRHISEGHRDVLLAVADGLMQFDSSRQPVLIIIRPEWGSDVLDLLADLYWLLPQSVQYAITSASHVVDQSDYVRDAALLFTYPDTTFAEESKRRRDPRAPRVLDLSSATVGGVRASGPYATLLREYWPEGGSRPVALEEWDALGLAPEHADGYLRALRLRGALRDSATIETLGSVSGQFDSMDASHPTYRVVQDASTELVERLVGAQRGEGLFLIAKDVRWPAQAREMAVDAILSKRDGVRTLLTSEESPDAVVIHRLARAAKRDANIVEAALKYACTPTATSQLKHLAASLLEQCTPTESAALGWADLSVRASPETRTILCPALVEVLAQQAQPDRVWAQFQKYSVQDSHLRQAFAHEIVLPVLQRHTDSARDDRTFFSCCNWLVAVAAEVGQVEGEVRRLLAKHRQRVTSEEGERWLEAARDWGREDDLRAVLVSCGLLSRPQTAPWLPVSTGLGSRQGSGRAMAEAAPTQSVGPIAVSRWLALLASLLGAMWIGWPIWKDRVLPDPRWLVLLPLAPAVVWMIVEGLVRVLFADPHFFGVVRAVRYVLLVLILITCGGLTWMIYGQYRLDHPAPKGGQREGQHG